MAFPNYGYGSGNGGMQAYDNSIGGYNPRLHYQTAKECGFELASVNDQPKTVYVGNLDLCVTEDFLATLYGQIGIIKKLKLISDGFSAYAFIEFVDHVTAAQCVQTMNKRVLMGKDMKVNWATEHTAAQPKVDTSNHFHVFVGDITPEVDNKVLQDAFAPFGEISDAKVIRDPLTLKSKGYGFVSYPIREQAERAIEQMNGHWLGSRPIRTNWATRKGSGEPYFNNKATYDEIYSQTTHENASVYVGGLSQNCSEEDIRAAFNRFGDILDVRHFKPQGFSFVKFSNKQSATKAIAEMNGSEFMGQSIKCSWGKSDGGMGGRSDLPSYGSGAAAGAFNPGNMGANAAAMQNYWNYYQQYYNSSPQLQQQWQSYWKEQQEAHQQNADRPAQ